MENRLSLYRQKNSFLHGLNPLTKLVLSFTLIIYGLFAPWYWSAAIITCVFIVPLSLAGKLLREYLTAASKLILPTVGFMFIMQSIFIPGGRTELFNFWIFSIELETVQRAFLITSRLFLVISSFTLMLLTTHPGELMSDLTRRGLPPQFAYVLISTLQIVPQMQAKAQTIIAAQRSRGLDTQGSFVKRVGALAPLVAPLVFGSLVEVEERAIAIEARGFTSSQPKTFLREIKDTRFDRTMRGILLVLVLAVLGAKLWLS